MIDLRSDTLTAPTEGMRAAMASAEVGDDVYGEDPTVIELQEHVAGMFGHQAALFTPTGSLANVLAVRAVVAPGQEVLCEARAHIARAELGAHGAFSGVTMRTWRDSSGRVDLEQIGEMFAPDLGPFFVPTAAVSVENTHNFAGGTCQRIDDLRALRDFADDRGTSIHMDGARIWNAHVATGESLESLGQVADVLAVCLSKGLGAPVGSLLVGSQAVIDEARVWRKRFGGGMRQVGVLAAAGLYALEHHLPRLEADHEHAKTLAEAVGLLEPETNMVVIERPDAADLVARLVEQGVRTSLVGPTTLRMVTHLDITDEDTARVAKVLERTLDSGA